MQSPILSRVCIFVCILFCISAPKFVLAMSTYGPSPDPIIVDHEASPLLFITCPPPITEDCSDDDVYVDFAEFESAGGSVTIPSECSVIDFSHEGDNVISVVGCTSIIFRTYQIQTDCGSTFTCVQMVTLTDTEPPVISSCPTDVTIDGDVNCEGTYTYTLEATDDCGDVTVTDDAPAIFTAGPTVVTYTVSDDCGNSVMCTNTVTITDNEDPQITCPPTIMTQCAATDVMPYTSVADFLAAGGSISDNCSIDLTDFSLTTQNDSSDGGSCPETVNRTYVVTDAAGNKDSCIQTIIVLDTMRPTFDPPADVGSIPCDDTENFALTGEPTNINDNCSVGLTYTYTDVASGMGGMVTITRTFTVTDDCGNTETSVQTIMTSDDTPPMAVCQDVTIYLDADGEVDVIPSTLDNGSSDNCTDDLIFSVSDPTVSCNDVSAPMMIELYVEDDAGNRDTCTSIVTVMDTLAPIITAPPTATVMCIGDIDAPYLMLGDFMVGGGMLEENCIANGTFTLLNDDTTGTCPIVVTREYRFEDVGGAADTTVHTQVVLDEEAPVIVCPSNITISETDICDTLLTITVTATDNCGSVTITNDFDMGDGMLTGRFGGGDTEVEFIATDPCGNADTCIVTVSVAAAPKITLPPFTATGPDDLPNYVHYSDFVAAGGSLNEFCGLDTATFSYMVSFSSTADPCFGEVMETVIFDDGGIVECVVERLTVLEDTINPVLDCSAQPIVFGIQDPMTCLANVTLIDPVVTDNFGVDTFFLRPIDTTQDTSTVYWVAIDSCGNSDSCAIQVIVMDLSSPLFLIDTTTVMCTEAYPQYTDLDDFLSNPTAVVEDCNLDSMSFMFVKDTIINGVDVKQYFISDTHGNESIVAHFLVALDVTAPVISMCSADVTMSVDANMCSAAVTIPPLAVLDNCIGMLTIVNDYNMTDDASDTYPVGMTEVMWTVTDESGEETSCTFMITVIDDQIPMISCPVGADAQCSIAEVSPYVEIDAFLMAGGILFDNCELDSMSFSHVDVILDAGPCPIIYERIYSIRDTNSNVNQCTQIIMVKDTVDPIFTAPALDIVRIADPDSCVAEVSLPTPVPFDVCGVDTIFNNIVGDQEIVDYPFPIGTTPVVFTGVDSCGNTAIHEFNVIVSDNSSPKFSIDTTKVFCESMFPQFTTLKDFLAYTSAKPVAEDCSLDSLSFMYLTDTLVGMDFGKKYKISDIYGNMSTIVHFLEATDHEGPVFDSMPDPIDPISCNDDLPPHEILTASDSVGVASIELDTLPYSTNICMDRPVTYVWIATDSCGNESRDSLTFIIKRDSIAPTVTNLQDTIMYDNTAGECYLHVSALIKPKYSDDCSGVDTVYTTYADTTLTVDTTSIEWVAVDSCGNRDTVIQTVIVKDTEMPNINCKLLVSVNLTDEASNIVHAASFVKDATDNCGIAETQVRRLTEVCDDTLSNVYREIVRFCCDDVGDTVMVQVRIIDIHGNISTCMASAVVADRLSPTVAISLPDVTISCDYLIDTTDLSEFGTYVMDEDERDSIFVEDHYYHMSDFYVGLDGLINENCTAIVTDSTVVNINSCNVGTVTRLFTFTDGSGNTSMASQTITIIDFFPFNAEGTDIEWPETFTWEECLSPAPDTSVAGAPIISNDDRCSLVSMTFKDLPFEIRNGGCAYIRRKWKVIDWCQYDKNIDPNPGEWTYNQDIYVRNVTAPTINGSAIDTLICAPGALCVGTVNLEITAKDDCTDAVELQYSYEIDTYTDGSYDITGSGSSFGRVFNRGTHTVRWTVFDLCGNMVQRTDVFTVKDCKLPTAVCLNLALSLGEDGTVALWASDINNKSNDNCTAKADLILSFTTDVTDFGRSYTCDDVGIQIVELWVTDEDGNQNFCVAEVDIQDNDNACTENITTTIMGQIETAQGVAIYDSKVTVVGAELTEYHMTDEQGGYAFMDITAETNVEVTVQKDGAYLDGVNTMDIVAIQRHILGLQSISSPYDIIAGDVNNDERLTPADLLVLRKLILGVLTEIPDNDVWRFVNMAELGDDEQDPWPFSETIDVTHGQYRSNCDFVGVKVGDVDNSIDNLLETEAESRSTKYLGLVTSQQVFTAGSMVNVPVHISRSKDLQAVQFTLEYDAAALRFVEIAEGNMSIKDEHIGLLSNGVVTLSWNDVSLLESKEGERLFTIEFESIQNGDLRSSLDMSSSVTSALAFDEVGEQYELNLDYINDIRYKVFLYQNRPNPFFNETVVEFDLPEELEVSFTIFDATGKHYWSETNIFPPGQSSLLIDDQLKGRKGIFYLKMETAEYQEVIKMIKIE